MSIHTAHTETDLHEMSMYVVCASSMYPMYVRPVYTLCMYVQYVPHVCTSSMYPMYVRPVCTPCLYVQYVPHVCTSSMYCMYKHTLLSLLNGGLNLGWMNGQPLAIASTAPGPTVQHVIR